MRNKPIIPLTKRSLFVRIVSWILKLFKKKPLIFNDNEVFPKQAIFIANHSGASGPINLSLYFPSFFVPWGAHPMTEGYRSRFSYLYHIFYQQKLGFHKLPAALIAIPFALISKLLYDGMPVIPTYSDIRIRKTMEISKKHLNLGHPILVFPEDSNNGYEDIIQFYNSGFVYLALDYFKDTQIDLPIYPVYCNSKNNTMLIEKPLSIQDYVKMGFRRDQIAEAIKNKVNQMAHELNQRKSI